MNYKKLLKGGALALAATTTLLTTLTAQQAWGADQNANGNATTDDGAGITWASLSTGEQVILTWGNYKLDLKADSGSASKVIKIVADTDNTITDFGTKYVLQFTAGGHLVMAGTSANALVINGDADSTLTSLTFSTDRILEIAGNTTAIGTFTTLADKGTIRLSGGNLTMGADLGTSTARLGTLEVKADATLNTGTSKTAYVKALTLAGDKTLTLNATIAGTLDATSITTTVDGENTIVQSGVPFTIVADSIEKIKQITSASSAHALTLKVKTLNAQTIKVGGNANAEVIFHKEVEVVNSDLVATTDTNGILTFQGTNTVVNGQVFTDAVKGKIGNTGAVAKAKTTFVKPVYATAITTDVADTSYAFQDTVKAATYTANAAAALSFAKDAEFSGAVTTNGKTVSWTGTNLTLGDDTTVDGKSVMALSGKATVASTKVLNVGEATFSAAAFEGAGKLKITHKSASINVPSISNLLFDVDSAAVTVRNVTGTFEFAGKDSTVTIAAGGQVGDISTTTTAKGSLVLGSGVTLGTVAATGLKLKSIENAGNNALTSGIYTAALTVNKGTTLSLAAASEAEALTVNGTLVLKNASKLGAVDEASIKGTGTIGFQIASVADKTNGSLAIEGNANAVAPKIRIYLPDSGTEGLPEDGTVFTLITGTTATAEATLPKLASLGYGYVLSVDGNNVIATVKRASWASKVSSSQDARFLTAMQGAWNKTSMQMVLNRTADATPGELPKLLHELRGDPQSVTSVVASTVGSLNQASMGATDARMAAVSGGVAAGDATVHTGSLWAKLSTTSSTQKTKDDYAGFRGKAYGAIIGADVSVMDNLLAGIAFGFHDGEVKFRDIAKGDKSDMETMHALAYGMFDVMPNVYVSGQLGLSKTSVKSTRRLDGFKALGIAVDSGVAKARYDVTSMFGKLETGYRYALANQATITPFVSLSHQSTENDKFTETGGGELNRIVDSKRVGITTATLGGRLSLDVTDGVMVEGHAALAQDIQRDKAKISFAAQNLSNVKLSAEGMKPARTALLVGVGLTTDVADNVDLSLAYDAEVRSKYVGHNSQLKLKFKF